MGIVMEISVEEHEVITAAIVIASRNCNGGVRTLVQPDGLIMTNYVPFRKYFRDHVFSKQHQDLALKVWENVYNGTENS